MRIVVIASLMLAGCANPYMIPPPTRLVVVPMRPPMPRYEPPPVVFKPLPPPAVERTPDPEPAVVFEPPATGSEPLAPLPSVATPVAVQKPRAPEPGGAVPMMGFRPMKGQVAKVPSP